MDELTGIPFVPDELDGEEARRRAPYSDVFEMIGHHGPLGPMKRVMHRAVVLHGGWEMDNEAWAVEFENGVRAPLTTSHGGFYIPKRKEFEEKLAETEASARSIRELLAREDLQWRM